MKRKPFLLKKFFKAEPFFILNNISAYVAYIDANTLRYKFVNNAFIKAYNISREQIIGKHMNEILSEKNYQNAIKYISIVKKGKIATYEYYFNMHIGKRWIKVEYIPEFDINKKVCSFIVLGSDITDRKIAEEKLQKSEARYRFMVETANEGILITRHDLKIIFVNNKLASMLGYEIKELMGQRFKDLLFEEHLEDLKRKILERIQGKDATYDQYLRKKDGSKHWVTISVKAMMDNKNNYMGSFIMLTDIHARKVLEEQLKAAIKKLEVLSNVDGLTDLANRRYFDNTVSLEYDKLAKHGELLSFIMIDIDFFKGLNDYYGHLVGDDCLKQVAKALAGSVSDPTQLIARYGGEEFICMLPKTNEKDAETLAEKMRIAVEKLHISNKGSKISTYLTVSLGVVTMQCSPEQEVIELINHADKALYRAKSTGRNRVCT
ncbi:sensor domain-containing diguanylate cyclase [Propionispira raffinosivorans]|uniref:sensor domain-containing diguanylate cyclase n=1 Tax=Propionispira raffinosivorans TaxID=86959 RepID=UPI000365DA04|nr:diguanylate cyclase [Propionispira raffinosivorans]